VAIIRNWDVTATMLPLCVQHLFSTSFVYLHAVLWQYGLLIEGICHGLVHSAGCSKAQVRGFPARKLNLAQS